MAQLVGCIEGMAEAARALDFPVVSGNVSLYNETNGKAILPTPVIGGVGLIDRAETMMTLALKAAGDMLILLGRTRGHLGQSLYLREIAGREAGTAPDVDLMAERANGDFVRGLIAVGRVQACHDLSDGGLLVALAEMAMAGRLGLSVEPPEGPGTPPLHAWLFGEDQSRYVIEVTAEEAPRILKAAAKAGVPAERIGTVGGSSLTLPGRGIISVESLRQAHEGWFRRLMGEE
jgi:phosphoribosylformylglycinamidine synthase